MSVEQHLRGRKCLCPRAHLTSPESWAHAHFTQSICEGRVEAGTEAQVSPLSPFTLQLPPTGGGGLTGPWVLRLGAFPTYLSLCPLQEQEPPRPLGREGFWGPWVGVGHIALCS